MKGEKERKLGTQASSESDKVHIFATVFFFFFGQNLPQYLPLINSTGIK